MPLRARNGFDNTLKILGGLELAVDLEDENREQRKVLKTVREFGTYISALRFRRVLHAAVAGTNRASPPRKEALWK